MKSILILLLTLMSVLPAWALPIDQHSSEAHVVKTIETGTAAFQLRIDMIERAQKSIDVEYFIFHKSDATRIFVEALLKKKAENPNIKIRMILDYFDFSKSLDPYLTTALMKKGIEVKYYNDAFILNLTAVTSRNHRKILLIDNKEAIIGGRNMGDEYYDLKEKYNFMDRDVWVEGPITQAIAESFNHFWDFKRTKAPKEPRAPVRNHNDRTGGSYQVELMRHRRKLREAENFAQLFNPLNVEDARLLGMKAEFKRIGQRLLLEEPDYEVSSVRFIADGPDWKDATHRVSGKLYYQMMEEAERSVMIETPYFYLQRREKEAFQRLKDKGVTVDLLLNSKKASNEFAINYITLLQGLEFSRMGFDLFLHRGPFMAAQDLVVPQRAESASWMVHAKTLITDDNKTWIGTLNMDPRSIQRLNAELALVVEDGAFNLAVKRHMKKRLKAGQTVVNGRVREQHGDEDPAQLEGLWENIRSINTLPFYIFENQI